MAIAPAVGLGMVVVFLVGAGVTFLILGQLIKRKRVAQALHPDPLKQAEIDRWTEERIQKFAVLGGGLTVALLVLSFFVLPRQWFYGAWIGLTVIGILFGISTFFIFGRTENVKIYGEDKPPASGVALPTPTASTGTAPHIPPPTSDNPYRDLLIKVHYDQALAERLIAYERKHAPSAKMDDLCQNAIARLERDNR